MLFLICSSQDLHITFRSHLPNLRSAAYSFGSSGVPKVSFPMQNKTLQSKNKTEEQKKPSLKWDLERTFFQTACLHLNAWQLVTQECIRLFGGLQHCTQQTRSYDQLQHTHLETGVHAVPLKDRAVFRRQRSSKSPVSTYIITAWWF